VHYVQHSVMKYSAVQYRTVQFSTLQYSAHLVAQEMGPRPGAINPLLEGSHEGAYGTLLLPCMRTRDGVQIRER
jgi:hypothetical protein